MFLFAGFFPAIREELEDDAPVDWPTQAASASTTTKVRVAENTKELVESKKVRTDRNVRTGTKVRTGRKSLFMTRDTPSNRFSRSRKYFFGRLNKSNNR
jgi:hypothetical protein